MLRVWPTIGSDRSALPCHPESVGVRDDGEVFYLRSGLYRREASGDPVMIPTPPCFASVSSFGFDGAGRLFYTCPDSIRVGNGELVADVADPPHIAGVLSSGKLVVVDKEAEQFALWSDTGMELSRLDLHDWVGTTHAYYFQDSVTIQGDSGFVTVQRTYRDGTRHEIVIFRVDGATAEWRLVRRVPIGQPNAFTNVALPDGRLLRSLAGRPVAQLLEFPPDAAPREIVGPDMMSGGDIARGPIALAP